MFFKWENFLRFSLTSPKFWKLPVQWLLSVVTLWEAVSIQKLWTDWYVAALMQRAWSVSRGRKCLLNCTKTERLSGTRRKMTGTPKEVFHSRYTHLCTLLWFLVIFYFFLFLVNILFYSFHCSCCYWKFSVATGHRCHYLVKNLWPHHMQVVKWSTFCYIYVFYFRIFALEIFYFYFLISKFEFLIYVGFFISVWTWFMIFFIK